MFIIIVIVTGHSDILISEAINVTHTVEYYYFMFLLTKIHFGIFASTFSLVLCDVKQPDNKFESVRRIGRINISEQRNSIKDTGVYNTRTYIVSFLNDLFNTYILIWEAYNTNI